MLRLLPFLALLVFHVTASAADRPNILLIAVDDLRPELGTYGTRGQRPNLDALAASGLQFDRAYCNQAVCGASRVSLMMGLYPTFTGEQNFHVDGWRKRWAHVPTLNQHLGANGYETIGMGKIYHGTKGRGVDPENWEQWIELGGTTYANQESVDAIKEKKAGKKRGPSTEAGRTGDDFYSDGIRAAKAVEVLGKLAKKNGGKPFFLAVGFTKPHLPFVAPRKYWDLYERDSFSLPENTGVPPGYPDFARNKTAGELRSYSDCPDKILPSEFPDDYNKRLIHGYHACVSYMDAQVGRVLTALNENGFAENTIVVFWADHGWKLGDHSSWCKHTNFECDTRVPLFIRHPKIESARGQTDSLVELIDLYPTICDLTGVTKPAHLQGLSLVPILEDPSANVRESAYSSYPHNRSKGETGVTGHSLRFGDYRYTEWWEKGTDKLVDAILTDIVADPGETTNLATTEANAGTVKDLSTLVRARVTAARKNGALKRR